MKKDRLFNGWTLATILPVLIILAGGAAALARSCDSPGIEIIPAQASEIVGNIYVTGEVNNPGLYPLYAGDSLEDIIRAAGGIKSGADLDMIELSIAPAAGGSSPQKIDINRAETWLLEALPGIGEARARAIIDYRRQNGPFRDINELMNVPGFGVVNFTKVRDFITVND